MPIKTIPHEEKYKDAVEAFNQRMRAAGSDWGFYTDPVPDWIPYQEDAKTWREYHLAIEDETTVRGGYALKPQDWYVNDELVCAADWQGPFTEGEINPKYSLLMLRLARSAQAQFPNLYSLGHSDKDVESLVKLGWGTLRLPFCFSVVNAYRFFRHNGYLRTTRFRRLACDFLAFTGLGALAMGCRTATNTLFKSRKQNTASAEVVHEFGPWADDVWEENKHAYTALAKRNADTMNRLLPQVGWPGGIRLRVARNNSAIGWSVVLIKEMESDPRFGSLRVGLVADCFGHPDDAYEILSASHQYLKEQGVDLICMNFSHPGWLAGLSTLGYIRLDDRRTFAFSPSFKEILQPLAETQEGLHLTNLDGHGPHGFTEA